eukprot:scaffold202456_cov28-Tisochrysis_lutea.AAC.8
MAQAASQLLKSLGDMTSRVADQTRFACANRFHRSRSDRSPSFEAASFKTATARKRSTGRWKQSSSAAIERHTYTWSPRGVRQATGARAVALPRRSSASTVCVRKLPPCSSQELSTIAASELFEQCLHSNSADDGDIGHSSDIRMRHEGTHHHAEERLQADEEVEGAYPSAVLSRHMVDRSPLLRVNAAQLAQHGQPFAE